MSARTFIAFDVYSSSSMLAFFIQALDIYKFFVSLFESARRAQKARIR
jgi:hypothetical protein